jgi:hypothetical protein
MMKRLFLALVAALSILCVSSCNLSEKIIEVTVEQAQASCPMDLGNGLTITGVRYADGYVTYVYQCEEDSFDYDLIMDQNDKMKEAVVEELRGQAEADKSVKAFLEALKKSGTGLIYQYNIPGADAPAEIQVESVEL